MHLWVTPTYYPVFSVCIYTYMLRHTELGCMIMHTIQFIANCAILMPSYEAVVCMFVQVQKEIEDVKEVMDNWSAHCQVSILYPTCQTLPPPCNPFSQRGGLTRPFMRRDWWWKHRWLEYLWWKGLRSENMPYFGVKCAI